MKMKSLFTVSLASAAFAISAIPVLAGVPETESATSGKWQKVNDNWLIDTQDVEIKGDKLRFWVERVATGDELGTTQGTASWKGKIRIRCGDFHTRIDAEGRNGYGMPIIVAGRWQKIKPTDFAYALASNFCYLTKSPGYTPEPIIHSWQRILTKEIKKQLTPAAIKKREKEECRSYSCRAGH